MPSYNVRRVNNRIM